MTIAAEYTGGKRPSLDITIIADGRRSTIKTIAVSGRREARKVAAEQGAQPWNF
jgi:hypothetical protein